MLAESLHESELFSPLLNLDAGEFYDTEEQLHNPRVRGWRLDSKLLYLLRFIRIGVAVEIIRIKWRSSFIPVRQVRRGLSFKIFLSLFFECRLRALSRLPEFLLERLLFHE